MVDAKIPAGAEVCSGTRVALTKGDRSGRSTSNGGTEMRKSAMTAAALFVFIGLPSIAPAGWAQFGNVHETHFLTFDAPINLPDGTTLSPGTYLFSWNPVQRVTRILSEDRSKTYATLQAIPVRRPDVREHDIGVERTSANAPPPLKAWFCPGNSTGHEFLSAKK